MVRFYPMPTGVLSQALLSLLVCAVSAGFLQSAAARPIPACAESYVKRGKSHTLNFVFIDNSPNRSGPSSIEEPLDAVRCSPGGRIAIVSPIDINGDLDAARGAISLDVIDPVTGHIIYDGLSHGYNFSADNRLTVFRPWGGINGPYDLPSSQSLSLLDIDGTLDRDQNLKGEIDVYPAGALAFQAKYRDGTEGQDKYWKAFRAWSEKYEASPHPVTEISWKGNRRFAFVLARDMDALDRRIEASVPFQTATVTVDLVRGKPAAAKLSIVDGPDCRNGFDQTDGAVDFDDLVRSCAAREGSR